MFYMPIAYGPYTVSQDEMDCTERSLQAKRDRIKPEVQALLVQYGCKPIRNDFFGGSSYFYVKHSNTVYEVDNGSTRAQLLHPSVVVDRHLRKLNNLPDAP